MDGGEWRERKGMEGEGKGKGRERDGRGKNIILHTRKMGREFVEVNVLIAGEVDDFEHKLARKFVRQQFGQRFSQYVNQWMKEEWERVSGCRRWSIDFAALWLGPE